MIHRRYKLWALNFIQEVRATGKKIPESMIQKKRELHLSYSQAFGVARKTDKFRPRYSAGVHLISVLHLLIAKFREYSEYRKRFVY